MVRLSSNCAAAAAAARGAPELKAGHPPAVKAAGKRLSKKSSEEGATHGTTEKETKKAADRGRYPVPRRMQPVEVLMLGMLSKQKCNFPQILASDRHSRQVPALAKAHRYMRIPIQQPKKC